MDRWIDVGLVKEIGCAVILSALFQQIVWGWPSSTLGYLSVVAGWGLGIIAVYGARALWRRHNEARRV